jgi:hypothetical protein
VQLSSLSCILPRTKAVTTIYSKRLHAHVRDLCMDGMQTAGRSEIEYRWFLDFLMADVVQAVQY